MWSELGQRDSLVICGFTRQSLVPVGSPCARIPTLCSMASRMEAARGRVRAARQQIATAGGNGARSPEPDDPATLGLTSKACAAPPAVLFAGSGCPPVSAAALAGGPTLYGRRDLHSRGGFGPGSSLPGGTTLEVPRGAPHDGAGKRAESLRARVGPRAGLPTPDRVLGLPVSPLTLTSSTPIAPARSTASGSTSASASQSLSSPPVLATTLTSRPASTSDQTRTRSCLPDAAVSPRGPPPGSCHDHSSTPPSEAVNGGPRKRPRVKAPPVYNKKRGSRTVGLQVASDEHLRDEAMREFQQDKKSAGDTSDSNLRTWVVYHHAWWNLLGNEVPVYPLTPANIDAVGPS